MADGQDNALEQAFRNRDETLRGFYHAEAAALSDEELASLTPILNSLKDSIPRYREMAHIAEGGEKRVALVHDHRLDRKVAMARAARAKGSLDQEQFLREARLTANLTHPNIMPVYNMGLDAGGVPFFTMELVPGDSLKAIIQKLREGDPGYRRDYPREALLGIFAKVCDAIAYAHSRNVLHLDIKPENIRVGPFGEVRVCDWGLARVANAPADAPQPDADPLDGDVLNDLTLSGTMKGTPGFMAPEQTLAYGAKTPQTDIYALGAVLYMLLVHELPVRGDSANEVIRNTREGRVVPPRRRQPERRVPRGLEAVMMKALALAPQERYGSALALRQEIDRFRSGHPTLAENAGWVTKASLLLQRHSRVAFLLIWFLLVLAGVVGANSVLLSREKAQAVAAREEAEDNFRLYLKEQQLARELGEELGEAVLYTVRSRDFVNAASMINVLETGLREDFDTVTRQNLLDQKGTLHFVLAEFNAAHACFEAAGESKRNMALLGLSRKYGRLKAADRKRMTDPQLAGLLHEAKAVNLNTLFYLYYHHMRRRPVSATPEEYAPLAAAMLDKLNHTRRAGEARLKLEKREGGYHLDLSGTPYSTLVINILGVYQRNVLAPLDLRSLDISRSGIAPFAELRGLKLDELRMVGLMPAAGRHLAKQLAPLGLKRVVLDTAAYPEQTIRELRGVVGTVEDAGP